MSDDKKSFIEMFAPPDELTGVSMALSAMSADHKTLIEISRKFTRTLNRNGYIFGHLFLDKRIEGLHKVGRVCEGIYHYPNKRKLDNSLLHAKVFLLGFGKNALSAPTYFRVIVYTGNLTTTSVNNQLELIWTFDLEQNENDDNKKTDLLHVNKFFEKLLERYSYFPMEKENSLIKLLEITKSRAGKSSIRNPCHFITSFSKPIIEHIQNTLLQTNKLNNIMCGSGFFEKTSESDKCPEVISRIEKCIKKFNSGKIVMNSDAAGAISNWSNPNDDDWTIHTPFDEELDPKGSNKVSNRKLHAKYILFYDKISGNKKTICDRGILYIGSGNLSIKGLLLPIKNGGNIECGVLLDIENEEYILSKLFVGEEYNGKLESGEGDGDSLNNVVVPFCPVLALKIEGEFTKIIWSSDEVEINEKVEISKIEYLYPNDIIESIAFKTSQVITFNGIEFVVPVITQNGLVFERNYNVSSFQEAMDLIENFQKQTLDDVSGDDGDLPISENNKILDIYNSNSPVIRAYPLHTATELIEKVASKNKTFAADSPLILEWLNFLENNFTSIFDEKDIRGWQDMGFNFLSILKLEPFSIPAGEHTAKYNKIINDVITKWKMDGMDEI